MNESSRRAKSENRPSYAVAQTCSERIDLTRQ